MLKKILSIVVLFSIAGQYAMEGNPEKYTNKRKKRSGLTRRANMRINEKLSVLTDNNVSYNERSLLALFLQPNEHEVQKDTQEVNVSLPEILQQQEEQKEEEQEAQRLQPLEIISYCIDLSAPANPSELNVPIVLRNDRSDSCDDIEDQLSAFLNLSLDPSSANQDS